MEGAQSPEHRTGKYSSKRDEALHHMSLEGWGVKSDGDVESPAGFFTLFVNKPEEMAEIFAAFEDELNDLRIHDHQTLTGNFVLVEDELGFVHCFSHLTEYSATAQYNELAQKYFNWQHREEWDE